MLDLDVKTYKLLTMSRVALIVPCLIIGSAKRLNINYLLGAAIAQWSHL